MNTLEFIREKNLRYLPGLAISLIVDSEAATPADRHRMLAQASQAIEMMRGGVAAASTEHPSPSTVIAALDRSGAHGFKSCSVCGQVKGATGFPSAASGGGDVCRKCSGKKKPGAAPKPTAKTTGKRRGRPPKSSRSVDDGPVQHCDRCGAWKGPKQMRGHLCIECHEAGEKTSGRKTTLAEA